VQRQKAKGTANVAGAFGAEALVGKEIPTYKPGGRWPANFIHDGSDEVLAGFPVTKSAGTYKDPGRTGVQSGNIFRKEKIRENNYAGDSGSAARFFYCAKASKSDRNEGLDDAADSVLARSNQAVKNAEMGDVADSEQGTFNKARIVKNNHPTVKPTALMQYLCRLITPPGGIVLDPFMGSGSTGKAAISEGLKFRGIDLDPEYIEIALARIKDQLWRSKK